MIGPFVAAPFLSQKENGIVVKVNIESCETPLENVGPRTLFPE